MQATYKYHFLFCAFIFNALTLFAYQLQEKQVDSILDVATNNVYEKPDEAITSALSIYNNTSYSTKNRIEALITLSIAYNSKRDYKKGLEYITKANELIKIVDDKKLEINILFLTGVQYQQLKIYDKSIDYLAQVEEKASLYPERDSIGATLATSFMVKGFIYKDNLNCDIALEYFNKALNELERIGGNYHNRSIGAYNKGNCYILLTDYTLAKVNFLQAIEFAKQKNATSLISFAEKGLAEVHTVEGNYKEALNYLESALNRSQEVGDLILNLGIYKGLFENNLALNNWDAFEKYYDLYLKTQLEIKTSERNSISVSLKENSKISNKGLEDVQSKFKSAFELVALIVIIFIILVFILEKKNKKDIKALQKKIETSQNMNPLEESK